MIKHLAQKKKPILLSTGMASLNEITEAVNLIKKHSKEEFAMLHCVSGYPSLPEEANLNKMLFLEKTFKCKIGLSDHCMDNSVATIATSLGAQIIEKHITLKRSDGGVDSGFSLEPHEFNELVILVKSASLILGTSETKLQKTESIQKPLRRSIYAAADILKDETFTSKNIKVVRPGYGLEPKHFEKLLGQKCKKKIKIGNPLKLEHVSFI